MKNLQIRFLEFASHPKNANTHIFKKTNFAIFSLNFQNLHLFSCQISFIYQNFKFSFFKVFDMEIMKIHGATQPRKANPFEGVDHVASKPFEANEL